MKKVLSKIPYLPLGAAIIVLSNPFLYLFVGSILIDIQNLFGAHIDRKSISFNTNDPFIQAMYFASAVGMVLLVVGYLQSSMLSRSR